VTTFEVERADKSLLDTRPTTIALGHASDGPLFVLSRNVGGKGRHVALLDLATANTLPVTCDPHMVFQMDAGAIALQAAADGRVAWYSASSYNLNSVTVSPDRVLKLATAQHPRGPSTPDPTAPGPP
jgi:hypothetical protein